MKTIINCLLLGFSLACISFVLHSWLFAARILTLSTSIPATTETFIGYTTQTLAIGIIVVVPSVVVLRQPNPWLFTIIVGVASPFAYLLSLYFQPYVTVVHDLKNDTTWDLFIALLVLMVMASLLAMAMRSSYRKKRWEGISLFVVGYLFVMGGAFVVTWYPLFFE